MLCPYLNGNAVPVCKAQQSAYQPSMFELQEYCESKRHQLCPFYCKERAAEDGRPGPGLRDRKEGQAGED